MCAPHFHCQSLCFRHHVQHLFRASPSLSGDGGSGICIGLGGNPGQTVRPEADVVPGQLVGVMGKEPCKQPLGLPGKVWSEGS